MVSSLYLSCGSSDFNEIWCATADYGSNDGHVTKYQNLRKKIRTLDSACMGEVALTLTHFQVQPIPVENTAGTRLREVDDIDNEMAGQGVM